MKSGFIAGFLLLSILGGLVFITLFSPTSFHVEALEFDMKIVPFNKGITQLQIPPVGNITAQTHLSPVKIILTLRNIDFNLLKRLIEESPRQPVLLERVREDLFVAVRWFSLRVLLLSAVGGTLAVFVLKPNCRVDYLRGGVIAFLFAGLLLVATVNTYDTEKFKNPQFEGLLQAAPWMINTIENTLARIDVLGEQLRMVAKNLYDLFESIDQVQAAGVIQGTKRILHVSDIHNNVAAYEFIHQIIVSFKIDLVIDTGDISDYGTPLEALLTKRIAQMGIPYVFVAGNHDSPEILSTMKRIPNVTVIDGQLTQVSNLSILGLADPSSLTSSVIPPPGETLEKYIEKMDNLLMAQTQPPDLMIIHNHRIARAFIGKVPLILHGHTHRLSLETFPGTVIINAGTTGAGGVRGLQTANEVPYSLLILYMREREEKWELVAVDIVKVYDLKRGFTVERRIIAVD
ncbi:MAG: metallophosphoesterase family protein [Bacillota bacterium]